jgi:hypothetical protein
MPLPLLSSSDYPAIRAAIDVSLDSTMLSDEVIAMPIYAEAAEAEVLARDPLAATREGSAWQRVVNAAIYLAAARLVRAVPWIKSEGIGGERQYSCQEVDLDALVSDLRSKAEAELAAVLEPSNQSPSRPVMFALASGRRGR